MSELVGLYNGTLLPIADLKIGISDRGLMQGAFIVDRLRTVNGLPLSPEAHAQRFCYNVSCIGLTAPRVQQVVAWIDRLCDSNGEALATEDMSIVLLAAPAAMAPLGTANYWLHVAAIDWARLATFYSQGQRLHVSNIRNIPGECWDMRLKNRSRLHYYLADQEAITATGDKWAAPVLLDIHGLVTETSAANIVLVEGTQLVSPPLDSIFAGLALQRNLQAWKQLDFVVRFEPISEQRILDADAIILSNSTGFAWHASEINKRVLSVPDNSSPLCALKKQLIESMKFDFIKQAERLATLKSKTF